MAESAEIIWADGPSSAPSNPPKSRIRAWGKYVESGLRGAAAGATIYDSKADMVADTSQAANAMAWVLGDATAANNGVYQFDGTSTWTRLGDLPYSYITTVNAGGTANAIVATTSIPVSSTDGGSLIALPIVVPNTASPVTVSFNGGAPLTIKTNAGYDPDPGALTAGMIAAGYKSGTTFRLLTDNLASSILADMEAKQDAAAVSATVAAAAAATATEQANVATSEATASQASAEQAQDLVEAATAGFTGYPDGNAYDFGYVADETTYFDKDWGSIAA